MDVDLKGKAALITGGTKGIGYAVAEALVKWGAGVYICARDHAELEESVARLL